MQKLNACYATGDNDEMQTRGPMIPWIPCSPRSPFKVIHKLQMFYFNLNISNSEGSNVSFMSVTFGPTGPVKPIFPCKTIGISY